MRTRRDKKGQIELMRLAWRYGGPKERFFSVYIPLSPLVSVLVAFALILTGMPSGEGIQILLSSLAVIAGWPSVMSAMYDCVYSAEFHRQALSQGWVVGKERAYYEELLRYRAEYGSQGHSPGQMKWGFAYAFTYFVMATAAAPLTIVLYPALGGTAFTPVLFVFILILLALGIAYSAHVQRLFRSAESKGFHLRELRRAMR